MLFRDLWNYLHTVHEVVHTGDLKAQDKAINALFRFLHRHKDRCFPALLYGQAILVLRRYPERVLPALSYYAAEDRQTIAEHYRILEEQLQEAAAISQQIEHAFEQLLEHIRNRTFYQSCQIAETFLRIAQRFFEIEIPGEAPTLHSFQKHLDTLQENFRYDQVASFFQGLLATLLEDSIASATSSKSASVFPTLPLLAKLKRRSMLALMIGGGKLNEAAISFASSVIACAVI